MQRIYNSTGGSPSFLYSRPVFYQTRQAVLLFLIYQRQVHILPLVLQNILEHQEQEVQYVHIPYVLNVTNSPHPLT